MKGSTPTLLKCFLILSLLIKGASSGGITEEAEEFNQLDSNLTNSFNENNPTNFNASSGGISEEAEEFNQLDTNLTNSFNEDRPTDFNELNTSSDSFNEDNPTEFNEPNTLNSTEAQSEQQEHVSKPEVFHLGPVMTDWDDQRAQWLEENPGKNLNRKGKPRMILVTSSQQDPCPSPKGDYYLIKAAKNKMDYAQLHDIQLFYNLAVIDPRMTGFFCKHPLVRTLMVTHPEAEWIWWMDSDAFITDMTFEIPLEKYENHNLVVHGEQNVWETKNWMAINAGIFIIRNCQWSLDMLDIWAAMGEDYGDHVKEMGTLMSQTLANRPDFILDDQSALVYMMCISHTEMLRPKLFLESSYALHGYWIWAMGKHDEILRDSPARKSGEEYWPFITHFVGCKSCTGQYASSDLSLCLSEMERAVNIADNQILHIYGYEHEDLTSPVVRKSRTESEKPLNFLKFGVLHPWGEGKGGVGALPE